MLTLCCCLLHCWLVTDMAFHAVLQTDHCLGGVTVVTFDLRLQGLCWLDSLSCPCQVGSIWMVNCLWSGKPSRYITTAKANKFFHPCGVGKLSIGLSGCGYGGVCLPVSGGRKHCVIP